MILPPAEQARVLLAMVLCGALLAMAYDALCALRHALGTGRAMREATDTLYGMAAAAAITAAGLLLRTDVLRWYTLGGALLGVALYRCGPGALLRAAISLARKGRRDKIRTNNGCAGRKSAQKEEL